jgi:hypothetical protein
MNEIAVVFLIVGIILWSTFGAVIFIIKMEKAAEHGRPWSWKQTIFAGALSGLFVWVCVPLTWPNLIERGFNKFWKTLE